MSGWQTPQPGGELLLDGISRMPLDLAHLGLGWPVGGRFRNGLGTLGR